MQCHVFGLFELMCPIIHRHKMCYSLILVDLSVNVRPRFTSDHDSGYISRVAIAIIIIEFRLKGA